MGAPSGIAEAEAGARKARADVDETEARILSGRGGITAAALHKVRDTWRHADLAARGAQERATRERAEARLAGLAKVGDEADKLASGDSVTALADALEQVAAAAVKVHELAATHDTALAELIAAATDLDAGPPSPAGPRSTSAFVAVHNGDLLHKNTRVSPIGDRADAALREALGGDVPRARELLTPVTRLVPATRPDYLLRGSGGALLPIYGPLNPHMEAQIRNGDVTKLTDHEVGLYMAGELA